MKSQFHILFNFTIITKLSQLCLASISLRPAPLCLQTIIKFYRNYWNIICLNLVFLSFRWYLNKKWQIAELLTIDAHDFTVRKRPVKMLVAMKTRQNVYSEKNGEKFRSNIFFFGKTDLISISNFEYNEIVGYFKALFNRFANGWVVEVC